MQHGAALGQQRGGGAGGAQAAAAAAGTDGGNDATAAGSGCMGFESWQKICEFLLVDAKPRVVPNQKSAEYF